MIYLKDEHMNDQSIDDRLLFILETFFFFNFFHNILDDLNNF